MRGKNIMFRGTTRTKGAKGDKEDTEPVKPQSSQRNNSVIIFCDVFHDVRYLYQKLFQ